MERNNYFQEDRRVFERIPVSLPVTLIDSSSKKEAAALACDVSAKGLGILSQEPLDKGDSLELWLKIPDKREPFYTRGEVAWTKLQESGEYRTGISLEKAEFMGLARLFKR